MSNEKGITLIALVITIIVLLILAGVTLASVTGYDGILPNAKKVAEDYKNGVGNDQEIINTINYLFEQYLEPSEGHSGKIEDEPDITDLGYVGYYADLNGDGLITLADDGIIYADLSVGTSGNWDFNDMVEFDDEENIPCGNYSYSASTQTFKNYTVVSETSLVDPFGTGKGIIKEASGTDGADRFFVMALKDVSKDGTNSSETNTTFWYYYFAAADYDTYSGRLPSSMNVANNANDFGTGKAKTQAMVQLWNNSDTIAKSIEHEEVFEEPMEEDPMVEELENELVNEDAKYSDLWVLFTDVKNTDTTVTHKVDANNWFIPSKTEWAVFAGNLRISPDERKGLSDYYWSSSQSDEMVAFNANFCDGIIDPGLSVGGWCCVRLSTTF